MLVQFILCSFWLMPTPMIYSLNLLKSFRNALIVYKWLPGKFSCVCQCLFFDILLTQQLFKVTSFLLNIAYIIKVRSEHTLAANIWMTDLRSAPGIVMWYFHTLSWFIKFFMNQFRIHVLKSYGVFFVGMSSIQQ